MGGIVFLLEVFENLVEGIVACLLVECLTCHVINGLVEFLVDLLAQFLVVHLVVIFALHVLAELLAQFGLQFAHGLDGLHGSLEGTDHILLRHFLHLAFHHHDVFGRGTHHDVHVGLLHLLEGGVDDVFALDTGYTHLTDGTFEGDIRTCQGGRGSKASQRIGLVNAVGREQHHIHKYFCMVVGGEERAKHAVYQTRGEDFIVAGLAFALGKSSRETTCCGILFSVVYLQRHEICSGNCIFCGTNSSQQYGVAHPEHHASISLLCHFPGFNGDGSAISQLKGFCNYVHLILKHL